MNRLALVAATGFLTLALTACGDHGTPKPTATPDATPMTQEEVAPVQPAAPEATVAPETTETPVAPEATEDHSH